MMNILYVWFPASWGPSVVEAIQTRNVTCLAKKPIVRDPHIFDRKFFLLYAAWVRSRAERPSVSYTKVVMEVARTGHNLHLQIRINQQNCGSNKFLHRGGREDETDARAEHQTHWRGASNEWMIGVRFSDAVPGIKPIGKTHRKVESKYVRVSTCAED